MLHIFSKDNDLGCTLRQSVTTTQFHVCSEKAAADIIKTDGPSRVLRELLFSKRGCNRACLACGPQCAGPSSRSSARNMGILRQTLDEQVNDFQNALGGTLSGKRAKLSNTESFSLPFATALRTRLSGLIQFLRCLLIRQDLVSQKLGANSALSDQQMREDRNPPVWYVHRCHDDMQNDSDDEPHQPQKLNAKQQTKIRFGALLPRGFQQYTDAPTTAGDSRRGFSVFC